jgi:hypothetical protein
MLLPKSDRTSHPAVLMSFQVIFLLWIAGHIEQVSIPVAAKRD